jgi:hypothetical protein
MTPKAMERLIRHHVDHYLPDDPSDELAWSSEDYDEGIGFQRRFSAMQIRELFEMLRWITQRQEQDEDLRDFETANGNV